jgi:branched-chain amino acid transport system ATP-binding protein
MFNAISGLNDPADGEIRLFGRNATKLPVHQRAALGVGRTFQLIQLFPQLDVFDNLLAATHLANVTTFVQHLVVSDAAVQSERAARRRVDEVVDMFGLRPLARRRVAELPFGVLRTVELARAIVTGAPLIMLDEPASGLDGGETENLSNLLRYIRAELGISLLLIEHDVAMVTSVTDYMYVINRGRLLAEGTPSDVQRNPEVIAAYLGEPTSVEAVAG